MKRLVILVMLIVFTITGLFCQQAEIEEEEAIKKSEQAEKKVEAALKQLEKKGYSDYQVNVTIGDNGEKVVITKSGETGLDKPFMGITYSDITLSEAAEIGYNNFYGIRLDTIVSGSSAYYYRLRTGDILMSINNDKIVNTNELGKVISYYRVGDKVKLHIFRDGKEIEKEFVFGSREIIYDLEGNIVTDRSDTGKEALEVSKKPARDYGDGTIAWVPSWYVPDLVDVNKLMHGLGFEEEVYSEDGLFLNGIAIKSNIGKGWFLGGQYSEYFDKKTTRHNWLHADIPCLDGDSNLIGRKAKFWIRYGGVSLDKRFVFGKSFYGEMGMLLTWGMNEIKVSQTAAASVPDFDFENENLSDYLDDYYNISSSINLKNYGIIAQPRISLGWRINDWLSIKAEAAYLHSVSMSGWEAEANHNSINITNKPDTNMDGLAFSIGPWLGF